MQAKLCPLCKHLKPISDFSKKVFKNSFKRDRQTHCPYCWPCDARRAAKWRERNKVYKPSGKVTCVPLEDRLLMSAIRQRLKDARKRSKRRGRSMPASNLSAEYLYGLFKRQGGKCALSGVEMSLETRHPHCLSMDRIDTNKAYARDNVQWTSWYVNRAKGQMSVPVFYSMCETILAYRGELETAESPVVSA